MMRLAHFRSPRFRSFYALERILPVALHLVALAFQASDLTLETCVLIHDQRVLFEVDWPRRRRGARHHARADAVRRVRAGNRVSKLSLGKALLEREHDARKHDL